MAEKILKLEELQKYHNKIKETFSTKEELTNHTHQACEIQGCPDQASALGTPFLLASEGNGAEADWIDGNNYYALKENVVAKDDRITNSEILEILKK